jgi:hypothetical protein
MPSTVLNMRATLKFLSIIAEAQKGGNISYKAAQRVFGSVLEVFIPRMKLVLLKGGNENQKGTTWDPILIKPEGILLLLRQCVSLELVHEVAVLFDRLDRLSRLGPSEIAFKYIFVPLLKEFDGMPPGQIPGTMAQEFHARAHQLSEKLQKLHSLHFPPTQYTSQPQGETALQEEEFSCTCKDCLRFAAFTEDPTAKSVKFAFSSESRIAHYKTHQLPQIMKGGFQHTCTITPVENGGMEKYDISVRSSVGTQRGEGIQNNTEGPNISARKNTSTPKTKTATTKKKKGVNK